MSAREGLPPPIKSAVRRIEKIFTLYVARHVIFHVCEFQANTPQYVATVIFWKSEKSQELQKKCFKKIFQMQFRAP